MYKIVTIYFILFSTLNANMTDISLALSWKNQFQFAGYLVAKEKGFYKDVGLNVNIVEYDLQRDITKEIVTSKHDFGVGHSSLILDKLNRHPNILMLSAMSQSSPLILLAKKRDDIKTIEDIKDKKIMMSNNQAYIASINAMLSSINLQQNSFDIIPTSFNPIDLINGNADLMISYASNEPYTLKEKGVDYTIFDPKEYGYDFYSDILFTSTQMIHKNPQIVDDFHTATMKGWKYAYSHIEETSKIIIKKYNTQNKSLKALLFEAKILKKLAFKEGIRFGDINPLRLQEIATTYRLLGLIKAGRKIDFEEFIYKPSTMKKFMATKLERNYLLKKDTLKICVNPNDMPFQGLEEEQFMGISSDFILHLNKSIDTKIDIVEVNSLQESITFLKNKQCDIIPIYKAYIQADKDLCITTSYVEIPLIMAIHKDSAYAFDSSELKGKSIGIIKNQFDKNEFSAMNIIDQPSIEEAIKNVISNEIFGFIGDVISVKKAIQINDNRDIELVSHINKSLALNMLIRSEDKILFGILQKNIEMTDKSVQYSILNKWLSAKYIKSYDYKLLLILLGVIVMIVIFGFFTKYQMNRLLKLRTDELSAQMDIFDKNISASQTDLDGKIIYVSEAFCKMSAYTEEELIGSTHAILRDADTQDSLYQDLWMTINSAHTWRGEIKNRKKDGSEYWVNIVISPIFDKNKKVIGFSTILEDITLEKFLQQYNKKLELEVKKRTQELEKLSVTDKLTGIYNRVKLDSMLNFYIDNHKRYQHTFSLLIIDIDYFKKINDTHGHLKGDDILKIFASILKSSVRSVDILGRWGGEEFMIICPNSSIDGTMYLAEMIRKTIEKHSFSINEKVTVSIGVAEISSSMNESDLIHKADTALYRAKENGRNRVEGALV